MLCEETRRTEQREDNLRERSEFENNLRVRFVYLDTLFCHGLSSIGEVEPISIAHSDKFRFSLIVEVFNLKIFV